MHDLLTKSMEEFRVENINIHGKVFEKVSGKMECAVAGGGNIYINQNIVIHMNKKHWKVLSLLLQRLMIVLNLKF